MVNIDLDVDSYGSSVELPLDVDSYGSLVRLPLYVDSDESSIRFFLDVGVLEPDVDLMDRQSSFPWMSILIYRRSGSSWVWVTSNRMSILMGRCG